MVWVSLLLVLALVVAMVVGLRLGVLRVGRTLGQATSDLHHAAEEILRSGRPPEAWRTAYRTARAGRPGADDPPGDREARFHLRRLDRLIRYFRNAPVFDAESTRAQLLDELGVVRERWVAGRWEGGPAGDTAPEGQASEPEA